MADDILKLLKDLRLTKYAKVFVKNEVEFEDLRHLSEEDLKELGLPVGPRKRLLGAIADFGASAPAPEERLTAPRQVERRQLTVLFVDPVGSTELSAKLDPERTYATS